VPADLVAQALEQRRHEILEFGKWVLVAYGERKPQPNSPEPVTFGVRTSASDEFPQGIVFLTRELQYDFNFGRSIPRSDMLDRQRRYSAIRVLDFPSVEVAGFVAAANGFAS